MLSSGFKTLIQSIPFLGDGLLTTLKIGIYSILIGSFGGVAFGLLRVARVKWLRIVTRSYLELFRVIPIIVWLFIVFFGIPMATGLNISGEVAAILVFSLWGIAEMGDIVRGALESLPRTQVEAGKAIGLNQLQLYIYILIPQAIRRMVPAGINLATRMIKTTSLTVLIGVVDVIKSGQQIIERTKESFWIYSFLFLLYFLLCYPLSSWSRYLEKAWQD